MHGPGDQNINCIPPSAEFYRLYDCAPIWIGDDRRISQKGASGTLVAERVARAGR